MQTRLVLLFCTGLLMLGTQRNSLAQATATGVVQGTVIDETNAVIPGASLTISNSTTGLRRSAISDSLGLYRFDLLPAGTYELRAELPGFANSTADNIEVLVGRTVTIDLKLFPAGITEQISVVARSSLVDLDNSAVRLNIT